MSTERKTQHLDLCGTDDVAFRHKTTLLEQVQLVHNALPEMAVTDVDLSGKFLGKVLRAPVAISAMTGGLDRAEKVNKDLATVAQEHGMIMGLGSMRPMLEKQITKGFLVRDVAPDIVLIGNLGLVQAREASDQQLIDLIGQTDVDAMAIHLNPAQEVIQPEGDADFTRGADTFARLVSVLPVPVIAKETGCGISRGVGVRLQRAGVKYVDCSGAGGTSWVAVETLRTRVKNQRLGELYWDWGIPTAASVAQLSGLGLRVVATGGLRNGLDAARAFALGATVAGFARPFLMAWNKAGIEGVHEFSRMVIDEIRLACLLCGVKRPTDLDRVEIIVGSELSKWIPPDSPLHRRVR